MNMSNIPVIFIHYGNSYYLEMTVQLAVNNGNKVIFLGDDDNKFLSEIKGVEFHNLSNYTNDKNYLFLGKKTKECFLTEAGRTFFRNYYNRFFAMEQWIILSNFLNKNHYDAVYKFDTDVFILEDLNKIDYSEYDFIRYTKAGFQSYVKTDIIHKFCDYLVKTHFFYGDIIMSVSRSFINDNYKYLTGDVDVYENCIYDKCISLNEGDIYETTNYITDISSCKNNIKKIYYDNDNIYFKRLSDNKLIRTLTLNLSWVKPEYFKDVNNFLINKSNIGYNFIKINNK